MKYSLSGFYRILICLTLLLTFRNIEAQKKSVSDLLNEIREGKKVDISKIKITRKDTPVLINALKDSSTDVRIFSAELLGNLKDTSAVLGLIEVYSRSRNGDEITAAGRALGKINDKRVFQQVVDRIINEQMHPPLAKDLLLSFGITPAVYIMERLKKETNSDLKNYFVEILTELDSKEILRKYQDPVFIEPVLSLINDSNVSLRWSVIIFLGKSKNSVAIDPLFRIMNDNQVYSYVLYALSEFNTKSITDSLISIILKYSDQKTLDGLGTLERSIRIEKLRIATEALGTRKDNRIEDVLLLALKVESWSVKTTAAKNLLKYDSKKSTEGILEALGKSNATIKKDLAKICSATKNKEIIRYFDTALEKRDLPIIAGAYKYYLQKKLDNNEGKLLDALREYGDRDMAEDYLNSGNQRFISETIGWARSKGYIIAPKK
jgi:HEAT repeat protein